MRWDSFYSAKRVKRKNEKKKAMVWVRGREKGGDEFTRNEN